MWPDSCVNGNALGARGSVEGYARCLARRRNRRRMFDRSLDTHQGGYDMQDDKDTRQEIETMKIDLAVQQATQAGAQATQAATQAGQATTQAAAHAGVMMTMAAGWVGFIVGIFLGLAMARRP